MQNMKVLLMPDNNIIGTAECGPGADGEVYGYLGFTLIKTGVANRGGQTYAVMERHNPGDFIIYDVREDGRKAQPPENPQP